MSNCFKVWQNVDNQLIGYITTIFRINTYRQIRMNLVFLIKSSEIDETLRTRQISVSIAAIKTKFCTKHTNPFKVKMNPLLSVYWTNKIEWNYLNKL